MRQRFGITIATGVSAGAAVGTGEIFTNGLSGGIFFDTKENVRKGKNDGANDGNTDQ